MTDYKKGKIYIIKSNETENVYIGSTCATLKIRLINHKSAFRTGKKRIGEAKHILKYADAYIELIEECPCETKRELLDREGEIIKNTPNCVNTQIQGRTMAEWRKDNDEKIKQYSKDYYEKNKDMLKQKYDDWYKSDKAKAYYEKQKEKRNVKVKCPTCEKEYSKSNLSRHMKTHK